MTEILRETTRTESTLESMSPRELRRYITLWVDGSFDKFLAEARACQEIALAQIAAAEGGAEHMEWICTLETIDLSIEYAEAAQMALAFGCVPPDARHFLD